MTDLTIHGQTFTLSAPFAEGHVLTAAQANALNQTRKENIGNQLRAALLKIKNGETPEYADLAEDERVAKMVELVAARDSEYEFEVRGTSAPRVTDPVEREALSMAREIITAKLREQGRKVKDVDKDQLAAKIAEVAKAPQVRKEAQRRVKDRAGLDLGDLFGDAPAPEGEAAPEAPAAE